MIVPSRGGGLRLKVVEEWGRPRWACKSLSKTVFENPSKKVKKGGKM